jgi:hypothetical protein
LPQRFLRRDAARVGDLIRSVLDESDNGLLSSDASPVASGGPAKANDKLAEWGSKDPHWSSLDPDALALAYLRNELARGPIAASAVDDMVERGRLLVASVDKAKEELGVVAVRLNRGRGAVVHLRLPRQSVEAEA